ncbi:hypothetical protein PCASD_26809 [Puccinia coronata f. sp. avenae]|uniref:Uncharacterized protein n=1 Tax=Puccinia coronata f. sp. avenae TaxID=200324 RepID=A0A2N5RXN9_9BASI|nr:hypothetical protein PCASD_26809 [Puccinia coronata f. sp. avenae]
MAQRCRVPGAPTHAELRSNPCSVRSMDKFPLSAAPLQELHCSRRGVAERGQKSKSPQQGEPAERVRLDGTTYPEEDGNTQQDVRFLHLVYPKDGQQQRTTKPGETGTQSRSGPLGAEETGNDFHVGVETAPKHRTK